MWDTWTFFTPVDNNWGFYFINAPLAWSATTGSTATNIGIIDYPVFAGHEDLLANIGIGAQAAYPSGSIGHGTLNAGIIAAVGDNSIGVSGVNWKATLNTYLIGANDSLVLIAEEMKQAAADGNRVVNMSIGTVQEDPGSSDVALFAESAKQVYKTAVDWAVRQNYDVLWVIAAGNDTRDAAF